MQYRTAAYSIKGIELLSEDSTAILVSGVTETGNVRLENQDSIKHSDVNTTPPEQDGYIFGVADGMGGFANGALASRVALETFFETFEEAKKVQSKQKMKVAIQNANLRVYQEARRLSEGNMGTTLTCVFLSGSNLLVGHIGDSRAYLIRNNTITCLTDDHTRVAALARMKLLSPDKVRTHSQRSVLEKSLGTGLFVQPDIFTVPVFENDFLVLCTDGVWAVVEDPVMLELVTSGKDTETIARSIIDKALELESDDNVSSLVVHLKKLEPTSGTEPDRKKIGIRNLFGIFREANK